MKKIMLLDEVLGHAFELGERCLIGKRDFITMSGDKYDFYFHVLRGISPESLIKSETPMISVLPYVFPDEEREAKIRMSKLFSGRGLETFALRNSGERIATADDKRVEVTGKFLRFYQANEGNFGTEIYTFDDYMLTSRDLMRKYVPNWDRVEANLNALAKKVELDYRMR